MSDNLRKKLSIPSSKLDSINSFLLNPSNTVINQFLDVVGKYGSIDEINKKAENAGKLENQVKKLKDLKSPYLKDIEWLIAQKDNKAFISMNDYKKMHLKEKFSSTKFDEAFKVTLEISALQYFPWLITQAKQAIKKKELMPSRFIRVRAMKESEADDGDLVAINSAMNILGATYVETLDTKGADGSNVHLGGPDTITGYFGGVGQPNHYALKWIDEFLYYYTNYGIREVLNVNPGTVILAYMLHKLGINNKFKISVFMGNDNPYSVFWTLMTAKLFSRDNDTTSLIGFNFSNSANNATIELSSEIRKNLNFEDCVRFEHHILETWKSIVRQPYDRTAELVEVSKKVKNISAKHEGGPIKVEEKREHPSDILDYFLPKEEVLKQALYEPMQQNYLDKHQSLNETALALVKNGIPVLAAPQLHEG